MAMVDSTASQALAHVRVVQAHAAEDVERATYVHRVDGYLGVIRNTLLTETALRFTQFATQLVADNIELMIGAQRVLSGGLTLGQYWAFAGYMNSTIDGAKQVGNVKMQLQQLRQPREEQVHKCVGLEAAAGVSRSASAADEGHELVASLPREERRVRQPAKPLARLVAPYDLLPVKRRAVVAVHNNTERAPCRRYWAAE